MSKLLARMLAFERGSPDKREVVVDAISETRTIIGIKEEGDKVILVTKERDDNPG